MLRQHLPFRQAGVEQITKKPERNSNRKTLAAGIQQSITLLSRGQSLLPARRCRYCHRATDSGIAGSRYITFHTRYLNRAMSHNAKSETESTGIQYAPTTNANTDSAIISPAIRLGVSVDTV